MRNVCNVGLPQVIGDVNSSISIGTAAADSIEYRAPAWYRSNPVTKATGTVKPFNLPAQKVGDLACKIIWPLLFWRIKTIQFEILQ